MSDDKDNEGEAPLAGENGSGIEKTAVPLTAFTENFSSIPLIAPPPFGKAMEGTSIELDLVFPASDCRNCEDDLFCDCSFIFYLV
jgi:hypothetical protein